MIPTSVQPDLPGQDGRTLYIPSDYYLLFQPLEDALLSGWRVSVGTLSFTIEPETRRFVALDAYSPRSAWEVQEALQPPDVQRTGNLKFELEFDSNGVAILPLKQVPVRFTLCSGGKNIRIRFRESEHLTFTEFGTNLIAGVDEGNNLSEVWMLNVAGISE